MQEYRLWARRTPAGLGSYAAGLPALGGHRGRATLAVRRGPARPDAATRQRHVVLTLCGVLLACAAVGLATSASAAWWAFVAVLPVAFVYVAMLLRKRRIAAEREITRAFFGRAKANKAVAGGLEELFPAKLFPANNEQIDLRRVSVR